MSYEKEAIAEIKGSLNYGCGDYIDTQALETALNALEKQIPKKPRVNDDNWFCCRNCGETFSLVNSLNKRNKYCGECGQALDWSDTNDR